MTDSEETLKKFTSWFKKPARLFEISEYSQVENRLSYIILCLVVLAFIHAAILCSW